MRRIYRQVTDIVIEYNILQIYPYTIRKSSLKKQIAKYLIKRNLKVLQVIMIRENYRLRRLQVFGEHLQFVRLSQYTIFNNFPKPITRTFITKNRLLLPCKRGLVNKEKNGAV